MKRTKLVAIGLAVALVFTLLVGCSGNKNSDGAPSAGSGSSPKASESDPASSAANAEPVKIRYLKPGSAGDSPEIPRIEKRIEDKFFEDTGIKIDIDLYYYDWDVIEQRFNLDLTAGNPPDMVRFWTSKAFQFYSKGYFQPLDDLIAAHTPNLAKRFSQGELDAAKFKGETVGFPLSGNPVNYGLTIRQDKLDALGMPMPTTVEDLENVMAAYKQAHPDEYPFLGVWFGSLRIMNAFSGIPNFAGSGKPMITKPDGTVTTYFMHENMRSFLELANKWYKNGWVSPDFLTVGDEAEGLFVKDSGLLLASYTDSGIDNVEQTRTTANPNAKAAIVPQLTASWGDETAFFEGYNSEGYVSIPKTVPKEKAEIIAKLVNWELDNPDNFWLTKKGEKGVDYLVEDGKMVIPDKWKADNANPYSWEHWIINRPVINGGDLLIPSADDLPGAEEAREYLRTAKTIQDPVQAMPYLPMDELAAKLDAVNQKLGFLQSEIILGKKPLSAWDEAAKIWADGGGADIEKKATEIYNSLK